MRSGMRREVLTNCKNSILGLSIPILHSPKKGCRWTGRKILEAGTVGPRLLIERGFNLLPPELNSAIFNINSLVNFRGAGTVYWPLPF
jgi:hypothetical protein